jgi:hypothetical protein
MQEGLMRSWKPIYRRTGTFEGYTVMGLRYEDPTGEIGWHTTSWSNQHPDPVHDYWVAGNVFYSVSFHYFYYGSNTRIEIFGPLFGIDAGERSAVLTAISEWKKSEAA